MDRLTGDFRFSWDGVCMWELMDRRPAWAQAPIGRTRRKDRGKSSGRVNMRMNKYMGGKHG